MKTFYYAPAADLPHRIKAYRKASKNCYGGVKNENSFAHYATSLYLLFTITLYTIYALLSIFFSNIHIIAKLFDIIYK
jgi:hypothetical protein